MVFNIFEKGTRHNKSDLLNKYLVIHCDADFIKLVISGLDLPNLSDIILPHHFSLELPHLIIEYKDRKSCQVSILPNSFGGIYPSWPQQLAEKDVLVGERSSYILPEILGRDT